MYNYSVTMTPKPVANL